MELRENKELTLIIENLIYRVLNREKLLYSPFRFGKVDSVISQTHLKVFLDGSDISQTIPCNPDVTFNSGDEVLVLVIPKGNIKQVICRRAVLNN